MAEDRSLRGVAEGQGLADPIRQTDLGTSLNQDSNSLHNLLTYGSYPRIDAKIRDKWISLNADQGILGEPINAETQSVFLNGYEISRYNDFEGGSICWDPRSSGEAFEMHGPIQIYWIFRLKRELPPISDLQELDCGGYCSKFGFTVNENIVTTYHVYCRSLWIGEEAHGVHEQMLDGPSGYIAQGGPCHSTIETPLGRPYGLPISETLHPGDAETVILFPDGVTWHYFQIFEHGNISLNEFGC